MALSNSNINHDEFVSVSNVLKECDDMNEEMENVKAKTVYRRHSFLKQCCWIVWSVENTPKSDRDKNLSQKL